MINAHKDKYLPLYIDMAKLTAEQSHASKRQVGCVIVTRSGMVGLGWNGMPAGLGNICEYKTDLGWKTKPEVIHAERNALDKLCREGVSPQGALLIVTTAPCIECAKSIAGVGISKVIFIEEYKNHAGVNLLIDMGVEVVKWNC